MMLQTTLPDLPALDAQILGIVLLAFLGGMAVPTRYGLLRLRGFGRLFASKLPAKPPAGMDREEWLRQATRPVAPDIEEQAGEDPGEQGTDQGDQPGGESGGT
jgi:hypothetical protein